MHIFRTFIIHAIRNYIIGSCIAVGIGAVFIRITISIDEPNLVLLLIALIISLPIMLLVEYAVFKQHVRPIQAAFEEIYINSSRPPFSTLKRAYLQTHRLPILAVFRTMVPHLFGLLIPILIIVITFTSLGWLTLPFYFYIYAFIAAVLVAIMHALIEFFFTTFSISPVLSKLHHIAMEDYSTPLSLEGQVIVSVRQKYLFSTIFIGIFPILLTLIALIFRFSLYDFHQLQEFWVWAFLIVLLSISGSSIGAWLLSRDIERPIHQLVENMQKIEQGNFEVYAKDAYSDEFSRLMSGFNHMVRGLYDRDLRNNQLLSSYFATLAAALDARDHYTAGHSQRVAEYSLRIGRLLHLEEKELDMLFKSALLHDIGKIGVRDSVLLKEGKLTDEEFLQMQEHPVRGEKIIKEIEPVDAMAPLLPGIRSHHERYDGKGYPDQLQGLEIPLFGRILALADAYDAMTSDRPYRKGMPKEKALSIIKEGKGTQWDPKIADLFLEDIDT